MKRVAITGSSGYIARGLATAVRRRGARTLGIDVRRPTTGGNAEQGAVDEFVELDIGDDALSRVLGDFAPDTIIHTAFVVTPIRDTKKMRRINVDGTRNLLRSAESVRPERLLILSSATAYGAWPDNPLPMEEDWPLRARAGFPYAAQKTEVESILQQFAARTSEIAVSWVRPAIVGGPNMDNYLSRILFAMPFTAKIDGCDQPLQFVHEQDVIGAIETILAANGRGAYNLAPPDWTLMSEIADATNRWAIPVPFWLAYAVFQFGWTLHLPFPETRPGFLHFARYPWVVHPRRLEVELGYAFKYSSLETLAEILAGLKKRPNKP